LESLHTVANRDGHRELAPDGFLEIPLDVACRSFGPDRRGVPEDLRPHDHQDANLSRADMGRAAGPLGMCFRPSIEDVDAVFRVAGVAGHIPLDGLGKNRPAVGLVLRPVQVRFPSHDLSRSRIIIPRIGDCVAL
jgi:hypothetical protein